MGCGFGALSAVSLRWLSLPGSRFNTGVTRGLYSSIPGGKCILERTTGREAKDRPGPPHLGAPDHFCMWKAAGSGQEGLGTKGQAGSVMGFCSGVRGGLVAAAQL